MTSKKLLYIGCIAFIVCIFPLYGYNCNKANSTTYESTVSICAYDTGAVMRKGFISPKDLGLENAKNDIERYWIIYNTHIEATKKNLPIDYSGIDSLNIELPPDAKSIHIERSVDFKGLKLYIKNSSKNMFLFIMNNMEKSIVISQDIIDGDDFASIPELSSGTHQLILSDKNAWVENREGHNYGHIRKDIRLIVNGKAQNKTIMPYGDKSNTEVLSYYSEVDTTSKVISNLTFIRSSDSENNTYFLRANCVDNIELRNMSIYTPEIEGRYADHIISINDCTNIVFRNVTIQGTYSHRRKYGYGISMDNVWNVRCYNLKGDAKWGVWGNNNVNTSYLKDCKLNRYDIHCYGRDITMEDCYFHGMGLSVASVYGEIIYRRCTLYHFQPVNIRTDYNSYVPFDLKLVDCKWYPTTKRNAIANMGRLDGKRINRSELERICWPNISISNLEVIPTSDTKKVYLYKVNGEVELSHRIEYLSDIDIDGIHGNNVNMDICNEPVRVKNKAQLSIKATNMRINKENLNLIR